MKTTVTLIIGVLVVGFIGGIWHYKAPPSPLESTEKAWQSELQDLEERVDTRLDALRKSITSEVHDLFAPELQDLEEQVNTRLDALPKSIASEVRDLFALELQKLEERVNTRLDALPKSITSEVHDLFALELQKLGDRIQLTATKVPEELTQFIARLPSFAEASTPSPDTVASLRQEVGEAVNSLRPLQRQAIADKIALAEWSLNALDLLSAEPNDDELLVQLVLAQSLVDAIPPDVPGNFVNAVENRSKAITANAREELDFLVKTETEPDLSALRSGLLLAEWMSGADLIEERVVDRLEIRLEVREWLRRKQEIHSPLYTFASDEEFDTARYALLDDGSGIVEMAVRRQVRVPEGFIESLQGFAEKIEENQRYERERQQADYQLWAIRQIQEANQMVGKTGSDNIDKWLIEAQKNPDDAGLKLLNVLNSDNAPMFRAELLEAAVDWGYRYRNRAIREQHIPKIVEGLKELGGWKNHSEMVKALTADALLFRLMVIDETYLDRPVAALYSDAFQTAWTYLEGTDYRLQVAKEAATLSKKQPGDDLSNK